MNTESFLTELTKLIDARVAEALEQRDSEWDQKIEEMQDEIGNLDARLDNQESKAVVEKGGEWGEIIEAVDTIGALVYDVGVVQDLADRNEEAIEGLKVRVDKADAAAAAETEDSDDASNTDESGDASNSKDSAENAGEWLEVSAKLRELEQQVEKLQSRGGPDFGLLQSKKRRRRKE